MHKGFLRLLLLCLGHFFVVLGIIGTLLPIIPTTPFLIVACICYARSSKKFHDMLRNNRYFGKPLRNWEEHQAISVRTKWIAVATIVISMTGSSIFAPVSIQLKAIMVLIGFVVSIFILTRRSI